MANNDFPRRERFVSDCTHDLLAPTFLALAPGHNVADGAALGRCCRSADSDRSMVVECGAEHVLTDTEAHLRLTGGGAGGVQVLRLRPGPDPAHALRLGLKGGFGR